MLTPRPLHPDDAAAICGFAQDPEELFFFFPKARWPLTPEQLLATSAERHGATVVVDGAGAVRGHANFYAMREGESCTLGNVVVDPAWRGRGAGRFLVQAMIALARDRFGVKRLSLGCFNGNTIGLLLYHDLGFVLAGMEPWPTPAGGRVALLHMRLDL